MQRFTQPHLLVAQEDITSSSIVDPEYTSPRLQTAPLLPRHAPLSTVQHSSTRMPLLPHPSARAGPSVAAHSREHSFAVPTSGVACINVRGPPFEAGWERKAAAAHDGLISHPTPCKSAAAPSPAAAVAVPVAAAHDCMRVILHFDVDAMYAQVEEKRDPSLAERPMGAATDTLSSM